MNEYFPGEIVICEVKFRNEQRKLTDPVSIEFEIKDPANNVLVFNYPGDPEIIKVAVGVYNFEQPATLSGEWVYRYEGTNPNSSYERKFRVLESNFP